MDTGSVDNYFLQQNTLVDNEYLLSESTAMKDLDYHCKFKTERDIIKPTSSISSNLKK